MNNSQKGFVVPLVITIVALLVIGGVYVYRTKERVLKDYPVTIIDDPSLTPDVVATINDRGVMIIENKPAVVSTPKSKVSIQPTIDSLSPASGQVGTFVGIIGKNTYAPPNSIVIFSREGVGEEDISPTVNNMSNNVDFEVPRMIPRYFSCPSNVVSQGRVCSQPPPIDVTDGTYTVSVKNAYGKSNEVVFTVSSTSAQSISVSLSSPNGGELWRIGQTEQIKWKVLNNSNPYASITIRKFETPCVDSAPCNMSGASMIYSITDNADASSGNFMWQVGRRNPNANYALPIVPAGQYLLTVCVDKIYCDTSDKYFDIVDNE